MRSSQHDGWPSTAVIIVNWNGVDFLGECLRALMAQSVMPSKIIVLDNDSSDASVELVRQFEGVTLIESDQNLGFAAGNNLAVQAITDEVEWIALVNPDAFVDRDWLEMLLVAARDNPDYDVFASRLVDATDKTMLDGEGDAFHISGKAWRIARGARLISSVNVAHEVFSPCAAAALYRRSAFLEVGGFDEDFFCYIEDVDLGFRLRLAGYRCLYVPQSVAYHLGSGTTGGRHSDFSVYHGHRNLVWTYVKNMPGILFWLFLPLHVLMNLAAIILFVLKGQGMIILHAKRDAIRLLPRMWLKRRDIQRHRSVSLGEIWRILSKGMPR